MPAMKPQLNQESVFEKKIREVVEAERERFLSTVATVFDEVRESSKGELFVAIRNALTEPEPAPEPAPEPMTVEKATEKLAHVIHERRMDTMRIAAIDKLREQFGTLAGDEQGAAIIALVGDLTDRAVETQARQDAEIVRDNLAAPLGEVGAHLILKSAGLK